ncbi:MAG TPA: glycoside hydrolase [Candidatus Kryptonia bacterium]
MKNLSISSLLAFLLAAISSVQSQPVPSEAFSNLHWRLVGPYRAGWATMAVGVPTDPNTFYFGGAGGGVWKTTDAGRTWDGLMQHQAASSVGAIDLAPSNPDIIYVGTGQVDLRWDILAGDGVYRSTDAGKTWSNIGLKETEHVGKILIDPKNPQRVLVAALGNVFAPISDRGIYLSDDGGGNWKRVLFVNDSTGAVDLASDPLYPSVVYAATWQMQMHPWLDYFMPQTGAGSGIYKSTDGGESWAKLIGNGLPSGPLGRIGLGVARGSSGRIVYATIITSGSESGLYKSVDGGMNWEFVNKNPALANPYFSRITVDPTNPNILYVMDRSIHRSEDGGKTFTIFKGAPGGDDYHFLWINPSDNRYMITASDQGCVVSVDGGKSWSSWYNQPTGQFYHVAVDQQFPYKIYSGQQDNGTVGIFTRGPYGVIEDRDWHPVGGDERDYDVPKPGNPNLIFGSGLGGHVSRFDEMTRQVAEISPWPVPSYGARQTSVKYRYTWITPLVFSPIGRHALYFGNQYLWKSTDDGDHWQMISPDLSGKKEGARDYVDPDPLQARDAGYGVIFSIAPSPVSENVIWTGTDDGYIQVTADGGKHWRNVTPISVPAWGMVSSIDASPFSAAGAYVAVNTHRLGFSNPIIIKTNDGGRAWRTIINGIPKNEYVNVVRADPFRKDVLYAGTNRSVYVSFDDGENWEPLTLNLPTTSITDLVISPGPFGRGDLVICTQGRGIWVLDDPEPFREMTPEIASEGVHLYQPDDAWRLRANENRDTPWPPETALGQNPPTGAVIDYWLKENASGPIKLTIHDSRGNIVREYNSDEKVSELPTETRYFQSEWTRPETEISSKAGAHRFVWDLRYTRPPALEYNYSIAAVWDQDDGGTPLEPQGPFALPGKYSVTLTVNGKDYTKPILLRLDPRVHASAKALDEQLALARSIDAGLVEGVTTCKDMKNAISASAGKTPAALADSISVMSEKGHPNLSSVVGVLAGLASAVQGADAAPTQGEKDVYLEYRKQLDGLLAKWQKIQDSLQK